MGKLHRLEKRIDARNIIFRLQFSFKRSGLLHLSIMKIQQHFNSSIMHLQNAWTNFHMYQNLSTD